MIILYFLKISVRFPLGSDASDNFRQNTHKKREKKLMFVYQLPNRQTYTLKCSVSNN